MIVAKLSRVIFSMSMGAYGIHHIILEHFISVRPGEENWVESALLFFAFLYNVCLVTLASALLCGYRPKASAILMGCLIFVWMIIRHLPFVIKNIADPAELNSLCIGLAISGAALAIGAPIEGVDLHQGNARHKLYFNTKSVARVLMGCSIIVIGAQHLAYADFIAAQIPTWIPAKYFLAYASGLALMAADVFILTGIKIRWGALSLGTMVGVWVIILHIPGIAESPTNSNEWTALFQAMAISAAGFAIWGWPGKHLSPNQVAKPPSESNSDMRKYKKYVRAREPQAQRQA